ARPATALGDRKLRTAAASADVDACIQLGDFGTVRVPFFLYQDLSFDVIERYYDDLAPFMWMDRATIHRRRDRQRQIYDEAAGVFAMSEWFARLLVELSGVAGDRVEAVHAGIHAVPSIEPAHEVGQRRNRLLFVGKDFRRKAGDVVVEATHILRARRANVTLTVAGPEAWPMDGPPPAGVDFRGRVGMEEVARLFASHDVFVMPSRFEPFGIVFAEALAHGMPCVARDAFAMPELVKPVHNGALVKGDDPEELADAISAVLDDDAIYATCANERQAVADRYSWDTIADRMLD